MQKTKFFTQPQKKFIIYIPGLWSPDSLPILCYGAGESHQTLPVISVGAP